MNTLISLQKRGWLLGPILGAMTFFILFGGKILQPTNVGWLMYQNDPATHFLGWHFFRNEPWHLPLGLDWAYGMEMGSSIVYTDSIPLLALIFKPFSDYLPTLFQYTGLWIFICFALQGTFGWLLIEKITPNKILQLFSTLFFIFSPPLLARLNGHYALVAHWLILASLLLYFSHYQSHRVLWIGLLVLASLIHAYLLAMLMAIWIADLFKRILTREINIHHTLVIILLTLLVVALTMWQAGYFTIHSGFNSEGLGFYRMHLLSPVDPDRIWSHWLQDIPQRKGGYEGFNYLGLGIIILGFVSIYELIRNPFQNLEWRVLAPLVIACVALTFYSLSNHIAFGNKEILNFDLPSTVLVLFQIFRGSGRFFWPVFYVIFLAIFYIIISRNTQKVAIYLIGMALFIQLADSSEGWRFYRNKFRDVAHGWTLPFKSKFWELAARKYQKVLFVLPENIAPHYAPFSFFAATNKMTINIGYFARVDPEKVNSMRSDIINSLQTGKFDQSALYVFNDRSLWLNSQSLLSDKDKSAEVDGFFIVAPGWLDCHDCQAVTLK